MLTRSALSPSPLLSVSPSISLMWLLSSLHPSILATPITPPIFHCGSSYFLLYFALMATMYSKSVSSLHTITSESTQCTCSHSTTNLASTNQPDRNERARSLGAEQRYQITGNGNGTQTKPSPKGSPKMQQRSRRGSWLFGRKQQQR